MSFPRNEDGSSAPSSPPRASGLSAPRKRMRTNRACEPCRSRKQSCNGSYPCSRCNTDGRECHYGEKEQKTPLTRQRMTQLEERLADYETLWGHLFSGYNFSSAVSDYKSDGLEAVLSRMEGYGPHIRADQPFNQVGHSSRQPNWGFESEPEAREGHDTLPPTRPPSRDNLPVLSLHHPDQDTHVYEWHEDPGTDPAGDGDAGMGSLIHGRGSAFFGLSSGAAFLNVIRKLSPSTVPGITPVHPTVTGPGDSFGVSPRNDIGRQHLVIPPYSEVKAFVDGYFAYFHQLTPLVHEPTVRAQVTGAMAIPDKPGNAVLFNMIFAEGALDIGTVDGSSDGDKYYLVARDALKKDMLHGGTLELVQGLAIMANYLQRSGRPNAGYLALGWALRMAMALGLHTPSPHGTCTPLEREMRMRIWWSIVTSEAGCSVTFGRPHAAGAFQLDATPLPLNCDDDQLTVVTETTPSNENRPTLYTALGYQSRLARESCAILDRILHSNPAPTLAHLRRYDNRILRTIQDMPQYMRAVPASGPYRLALCIQSWRTRDLRAILYRPLLLGVAWRSGSPSTVSADVLDAIDTCRTLASENFVDIQAFVEATNDCSRGTEWYTIFFAFQSCLTLLLSVVAEPHHQSAQEWRQILQATADWFRKTKSMTVLGNSYADVLEGVLRCVHSPDSAEAQGLAGMQSLFSEGTFSLSDASLDMDQFWQEIWGLPSDQDVNPFTFGDDSSAALPL